jgi:hypothetical protein
VAGSKISEAGVGKYLEMIQSYEPLSSSSSASSASAEDLGTEASDAAVAVALLCLVFHAKLHPPQQPSTRHYMEVLSVALSRRFPLPALQVALLPTLTNFKAKNQLAFSCLLVAADAAMHFSRLAAGQAAEDGLELPLLAQQQQQQQRLPPAAHPPARAVATLLLKALFPWVTASVGLSRLLAHCALHQGLPLLFSTQHLHSVPELAWVAPLVAMLDQCPDIAEQTQKTLVHLTRVAPRAAASLHALVTSPVSEHGEVLPRDAFSYSASTACFCALETFVSPPSLLLPS